MEFEDSRNALFVEPNAYIQRFDLKDKKGAKKIVFQEPYECLPSYYINNNFKKGNCDCVPKKYNHDFDFYNQKYNHEKKQCNHNQNCSMHECSPKQNSFGFDLKSLMPLLGMFNKGGGADFSQFANLLSKKDDANGGFNPISLISNILSNKDGLTNILNLFKGGRLFDKKQTTKKEIKSTDFEIKNYTRVE